VTALVRLFAWLKPEADCSCPISTREYVEGSSSDPSYTGYLERCARCGRLFQIPQ
jgi:hypothetical protein